MQLVVDLFILICCTFIITKFDDKYAFNIGSEEISKIIDFTDRINTCIILAMEQEQLLF